MSHQPPAVDRILDDFDRAWASGEQPDWTSFITQGGSAVDQELAWVIIQRDLYGISILG